MMTVPEAIQQGRFVRDRMRDCAVGLPSFKAIRRNDDVHQIEDAGAKLCAMTPSITKGKMVDRAKN